MPTPTATARPAPALPPALARMVEIHRDIAAGRQPVPAELWVATGRRR